MRSAVAAACGIAALVVLSSLASAPVTHQDGGPGAPGVGATAHQAPPAPGTPTVGLGVSPSYALNFVENGLPNGTRWSVTLSGTADAVVGTVPVNASPSDVLYDYQNGQVYVAIPGTDNLTVFNATNDSVVAWIPVGDDPTAMVLDPSDGYIYVTNTLSDNVSVIDDSFDGVIGSIPVGVNPTGIAINPVNDTIYVANSGTSGRSNLTVINGTLQAAVGSIKVGADPRDVTYDPLNGLLYVANFRSNNLTVINATTNKTVGWVGLPFASPLGPAVDLANGQLFVTSGTAAGGAYEINPTSHALEGTISTGPYPSHPLYDPENGYLYVGQQYGPGVVVADPASDEVLGSFPVLTGASWISVNNSSGDLYVGSTSAAVVTVVDGNYADGGAAATISATSRGNTTASGTGEVTFTDPPGVYTFSTTASGGYRRLPSLDMLNVTDANVTVDVGFGTPSSLTFAETGLLAGADWSASLQAVVSDGVVDSVVVGPAPAGTADDGLAGEVFVTLPGSGNVSIVNTTTESRVATVPVGSDPTGVLADPDTGYVYVANTGSDNVTILDGYDNGFLASVPVGSAPVGLTVNPLKDTVFVTDSDQNSAYRTASNVTVINGTSFETMASIPVGIEPEGIAYDPLNGFVYVANLGSDNLSVINATSLQDIGSISLGAGEAPYAPAFDNATGELYVTETTPGALLVINTTTKAVVGRIPVGTELGAPLYDALNGCLYVAETSAGTVAVVNTSRNVVVGWFPSEPEAGTATLDYLSDLVYYSVSGSNDLLIVNGSAPAGGVATLGAPSASGVEVTGPGATIEFSLVRGNYTYDVPVPADYQGAPLEGLIAFNGTPVVLNATYTPVPYSLLTFYETGGLPRGKSWSVALDGVLVTTKSNAIVLRESAGSYCYMLIGPAGHRVEGLAATGTVNLTGVGGTGPTLDFDFVKGTTFTFAIHEKGLPLGSAACADIGLVRFCSAGATVKLAGLSPGTYPYSVTPPAGESAAVTSGKNTVAAAGVVELASRGVTLSARFFTPYVVTFNEVGLPAGTTWGVTVPGTSAPVYLTNATNLTVLAPNGTHRYQIVPVDGYSATGSPPKIVVSGAALTVTITFRVIVG